MCLFLCVWVSYCHVSSIASLALAWPNCRRSWCVKVSTFMNQVYFKTVLALQIQVILLGTLLVCYPSSPDPVGKSYCVILVSSGPCLFVPITISKDMPPSVAWNKTVSSSEAHLHSRHETTNHDRDVFLWMNSNINLSQSAVSFSHFFPWCM